MERVWLLLEGVSLSQLISSSLCVCLCVFVVDGSLALLLTLRSTFCVHCARFLISLLLLQHIVLT